jgi:hypothetical protein
LSFGDQVEQIAAEAEKMGPASVYVAGERVGVHKSAEADRMRAMADEIMEQPWVSGVRATIGDEVIVERGDTRGLDEDGDDNDFDGADEGPESSEDGAGGGGDDDCDGATGDDADPTGPYEVRITSADDRPDIMTAVLALKKMFGLDNNLARTALQRAIKGAGITIVGRGLSERAALAYVADLAKHQITAEAAIPGALERDADYAPPTEKEVRAMYNDGTLDTYLAALSDAEARALHLALTQNATRASTAEVADKVRAWLRKPKAIGA